MYIWFNFNVHTLSFIDKISQIKNRQAYIEFRALKYHKLVIQVS